MTFLEKQKAQAWLAGRVNSIVQEAIEKKGLSKIEVGRVLTRMLPEFVRMYLLEGDAK